MWTAPDFFTSLKIFLLSSLPSKLSWCTIVLRLESVEALRSSCNLTRPWLSWYKMVKLFHLKVWTRPVYACDMSRGLGWRLIE